MKGILKKALCLFLPIICITGCGQKKEQVSLTIWGSEDSQEMLKQMVEEFKNHYSQEAEFDISIGVEEESNLADNIEGNPKAAADVFIFADDQFHRLMTIDKLLPITEEVDAVIAENGGADSSAIQCCSQDGKLYAYPLTASNGYFMYYNAKYFSEEDVLSLDSMLEAADEAGKYITMDWSSGWYTYSFFKGAGLTLQYSEDGMHNECNWNATDTKYTGVQVAQAMLDISAHKSFANKTDQQFVNMLQEDSVIAAVNGTWNASRLQDAWGENYRAVKLPTYILAGDQVQMGSFIGFKLVGVNKDCEYPLWGMRLARWISNEQNQLKRFEVIGEGPSNINAAADERVQSSAAIAALLAQAPYGVQQKVAEPFWTPATVFGTVMASGNPDNSDLQELLDNLVEAACTQN